MAMLAFLAAVFPALTSASSSLSGSLRGLAAGRRLQQPTVATWMPPKPVDKSCLSYYPAGCYTIRDQFTCLRSKDGRDRVAWSGLKIYSEPCVWCGGRQCTNNSTNLCEPYDFLYRGQGIGFASFLNEEGFEVASCGSNGQLAPAAAVPAPVVNILSSCAAHSACAAQGLSGDCCPTADNATLACCASAPTSLGATPAPALAVAATELATPSPPDDSWWQTPEPTAAETSCLMPHLFGCHVVVSREVCLGSKDARSNLTLDGLKIYGQPCVWCGGMPCRSGSTNLCEPLDYLMHGEGTAFNIFYAKRTYQAASCVDGKPASHGEIYRHPPYPTLAPLPQWWVPGDRPGELLCLKSAAQGCNQLQDMASCLSSRDGRAVPDYQGLKIHGEPCVWCGGGHCTSNSSSVCEPYDYVMRGEGTAFSVFWPKTSFMVANCHDEQITKVSLPDRYPTDCLEVRNQSDGCSSLADAASCLSSTDGRQKEETVAGLKMKGQPCVWCGGFPCTDTSSNKCEPYDYLMNGKGKAFNHFYGRHVYRVAGCKNGRPSATSLDSFPDVVPGLVTELGAAPDLLPFWVAKKPVGVDAQCLRSAPHGCRALKSMEWCMTSKDGSSTTSEMGLKIAGEPCVWCGGGPCTSNGTTLCEPFDFAMYGEGVAYKTFIAKGIYKVAECLKPQVALPPFNYSCLAPTSNGGCNSAWDAETCLASKDGSPVEVFGNLKVHNQPCVWCGGVPCHSGTRALCEAFDYAMNGEDTAFDTFHAPDTFRIAACLDGKPKAATLKNYTNYVPGWTYKPIQPMIPEFNKSYWKSIVPPVSERGCLMHHWYGCNKIGHQQTCLGSLDAQSQALFGPSPLIEGQPCVWCGGLPCVSGSSALCEPFDYVMNGEGKNFTTFYAKKRYEVARCQGGHPLPPQQTPTSAPWNLVPFPPKNTQSDDAAAGAAAGAATGTRQTALDSSPTMVVPVPEQASAMLAPSSGTFSGVAPSIGTFSGVDPQSLAATQPVAEASPVAGGTVAAVTPPAALSTAAPAAASDVSAAAPSSDPDSTASPNGAAARSVPIMPIAMSTLGPLLPAGISTAAPAEVGTTAAPAEAGTPVTLPAVISTIAADVSSMSAALTTAVPGQAGTPVTLPAVISTIAADVSSMSAALTTAAPGQAGTPVTLPAVISTIAADVSSMSAALTTAAPGLAGTPVTLPAVISTIAADVSSMSAALTTAAPGQAGTPVTLPAVISTIAADVSSMSAALTTAAPGQAGTPVTLPAVISTIAADVSSMSAALTTAAPGEAGTSGVSTAGSSADREVSIPGSTAGSATSTGASVPNMPVADSTLGPLPPATIGTAAPSSASTAAPAATVGEDAPSAEPASLSTVAPVTLPPLPTLAPLPTLPAPGASVPAVAPADCWVSCGKAGLCAACGEGKACCRPGFAGDPAVCSNATGYDSKWSYHQCVITAPAPGNVSSPAEANEPSVAAIHVRDGSGAGTAAFDMTTPLPGVAAEFRNANNETNGTLVVAHEEGSGSSEWWIWALLCLALLTALGGLLWGLGLFGGKKSSHKSKKKRGSPGASRDLEDSVDNESTHWASASEMEMREPLVQQRGASDDIFDQIDADHDGVITNAEWYRAMGVPQPTTVVSPGFQGMPMANAAASTTAPVSTMRPQVPPGVMAAPVASQPPVAIPVLAPASTLQPGMVVPRPIYRS